MHEGVGVPMCVYMCVHMYVYMRMCIYMCMCVYTCTSVCLHGYVYTCVYLCVCMCVYMCIYMCMHVVCVLFMCVYVVKVGAGKALCSCVTPRIHLEPTDKLLSPQTLLCRSNSTKWPWPVDRISFFMLFSPPPFQPVTSLLMCARPLPVPF